MHDDMKGNGSLVWHYTDGAGLKSILENNVLWASSAAYLNDFNELISGNDILKQVSGDFEEEYAELQEDLEKTLSQFVAAREENFILSGSERGYSLTMWRYYGQDQVSFAVGLDRVVELGARVQRKGESHPSPPAGYTDGPRDSGGKLVADRSWALIDKWSPMVYDPAEQKLLLSEALTKIREARVAAKQGGKQSDLALLYEQMTLLSEQNRIKDTAFRDEQELRILGEVAPAWRYVIHRAGRFGLIPYVELGLPKQDESRNPVFSGERQVMGRLPIKQINIGPTPFREEAKFGLKQLLNILGYHDVDVAVSNIPYR